MQRRNSIDRFKNTGVRHLYGVLGTLENLCELDTKAKEILYELKKPVSVCFDVKGGPCATIKFTCKGCRMEDGKQPHDILIPFSSCEKFNGMIDGTVTPIPVKGFSKIGFLLKTFVALTDRLTEFLRRARKICVIPPSLNCPRY